MSLSLSFQSQNYRTAYNPIEFVLIESSGTILGYDRFKYVIDVKDNTSPTPVLLGRIKVPADPNDYGRCDIHGIVESYIKTNLGSINSTTTADAFTDNANSYAIFNLEFGEEYDSGSGLTPHLNQVSISDFIVYNGALPNYRGTDLNFSDYQATDYFENFTVNTTDRKWLTNAPKGSGANKGDNQSLELTDEGWIYFLYDHSGNPITDAQYITYDSSGSVIATFQIDNNVASLTDKKMLKIPSSPNSINNIANAEFSTGAQPVITGSVTSYKIFLLDTISSVVSEEIYFNVDAECRYEVRRLEFLNALGGFDCFNFTKVSRLDESVERKFFKQNADNMTSGVINYALSDREKTQYYTKSMVKMKLTSDWIDVATFNWLVELIESPEIYLHEGGKRVAIQNINGNWEQKVDVVDSVFNLEVTLEFSMDNYRQRF